MNRILYVYCDASFDPEVGIAACAWSHVAANGQIIRKGCRTVYLNRVEVAEIYAAVDGLCAVPRGWRGILVGDATVPHEWLVGKRSAPFLSRDPLACALQKRVLEHLNLENIVPIFYRLLEEVQTAKKVYMKDVHWRSLKAMRAARLGLHSQKERRRVRRDVEFAQVLSALM